MSPAGAGSPAAARRRPSRLALLLGDPVEHSLSPLMHNAAFRATGVDAVYVASRVPARALEAAVAGLRAPHVVGANVTVPHKEAVIPFLDGLSHEAEVIGAVNTIVVHDGERLVGHNTDATGFLAPFDDPAKFDSPALILGAGGAARAATYALLAHTATPSVTIASRNVERALALVDHFGKIQGSGSRLAAAPLADAAVAASNAGLIVNATPVGMHPNVAESPWPSGESLRAGQLIYDLIYNPQETRLMRDAQAAGAQTIGGMKMLIGQAAEAFFLWTGRTFPARVVREALPGRGITG